MSVPRVDPKFTLNKLQKAADKFRDAGYAYWEAYCKSGRDGAVVWVEMDDGSLVVFSRGEYRQQIVGNIERLGPITTFGSMKDD